MRAWRRFANFRQDSGKPILLTMNKTMNAVARYDVTTASGTVLCGGIESLTGAYSYAAKCNSAGWSGLLIRCSWTGRVLSRA